MSEEIKNDVVNDNPTVVEPENKSENKTFTQEELDKIVADRVARERKKSEKFADYNDLKAQLEELRKVDEDRKKSEMSEIERLQLERDEALKKIEESEKGKSEAFAKANKRLIDAELKVALKEAGIRQDAMKTALKVFDVSSVVVDDEGNVQGVVESLETFKKDNAFMFGATQHVDPSPGNHEVKREDEKVKAKKQLEEAEAKARRTGKNEDRVAFVQLKKKLGLF